MPFEMVRGGAGVTALVYELLVVDYQRSSGWGSELAAVGPTRGETGRAAGWLAPA
jgi:hypothetical protein